MAKAEIEETRSVVITLSFKEAQSLRTLLAHVVPSRHLDDLVTRLEDIGIEFSPDNDPFHGSVYLRG